MRNRSPSKEKPKSEKILKIDRIVNDEFEVKRNGSERRPIHVRT